jgi:hypothetical protein
VVPRKGLEPPPSYREAGFKFTLMGSLRLVKVSLYTRSPSYIRCLQVNRTRMNLVEFWRILNRKESQKELRIRCCFFAFMKAA